MNKLFGWKESVRLMAIKELAENDFVKVIRCKDCKYYEDSLGTHDCTFHIQSSFPTVENGYCFHGVKKE